jgi:hypothetical protein
MVAFMRGIRKSGEGAYDEAIVFLREAIALKASTPDVWISLGEALARKAATLSKEGDGRAALEAEALDCLAEAVERGYRNPGETRKSEAFRALQASPRWEAIERRSREVGR